MRESADGVYALLRASTEQHPGRLALAHDEDEVDYAGLSGRVDRLAGELRGLVAAGDRVAVVAPNVPALAVALFAAWRVGAVAVPLNARLREYELRQILPDAQPTAVVTIGAHAAYRFADVIASLLPELPTVRGCLVVDAPGELAERRDNEAAGQRPRALGPEVAGVLYTSGTTGAPKGALVTHACAAAGARSLAGVLELAPEDTAALVIPASHAFGLGCLLAAVASGSAAALVESSFSFDPLLSAIEAHRTTVVHGAPALFGRLLLAAPDSLDPVRTGLVAGAPCPPAVLEQLDATGTTILNVFGMTEIGAATSCRRDDPPELRHTTVGRALEGYEFRVAEGEPGELQVRGAYVMPGYLGQPEQTAQAFDGDWFRTGDLGTIDEEGYIRIAGRAKEVVHVGGFNVFPAEVEGFLHGHPGVAQAVVVGVPHERMGEALAAFVVPRPGHDLEPGELLRFARPRIAGYKLPYVIRVVEELPFLPSGKPDRVALAADAAAESGALAG
jgi:acyl-CoA synthetase (AMP-forming)/AMP-acid ligase II